MSALRSMVRELLGLFVDDGSLALAIVAVVAAAALAANEPTIAGAILVVGCLAVLVENVLRAMRAQRR
jgi:hypothetical protein